MQASFIKKKQEKKIKHFDRVSDFDISVAPIVDQSRKSEDTCNWYAQMYRTNVFRIAVLKIR